MTKESILEKLLQELPQIEHVSFAYLFGSYAQDTYNQKSDIDIALYIQNYTLDTELQIRYQLSKVLQKDVDFVVLNRVKNLFLLESILKEGIVIKDNIKRVDFELLKEHDILDYKAFKRYIDAA